MPVDDEVMIQSDGQGLIIVMLEIWRGGLSIDQILWTVLLYAHKQYFLLAVFLLKTLQLFISQTMKQGSRFKNLKLYWKITHSISITKLMIHLKTCSVQEGRKKKKKTLSKVTFFLFLLNKNLIMGQTAIYYISSSIHIIINQVIR